MDSIGELLGKKDFTAPDEIAVIKSYIKRRYQSNCYIKMQTNSVIIAVRSSALAATIHLERQTLIDSCHLQGKKLIIRTGTV